MFPFGLKSYLVRNPHSQAKEATSPFSDHEQLISTVPITVRMGCLN